MKKFRTSILKTITALALVIAMGAGLVVSLGGKAQAATPINIAYAAGDEATINGGPVYNVNAYVGVATTITTVKPTRSSCNFLGWTTSKNSGRVDYKAGATVTFTKATTLWPVWNTNIAYAAGDGKFGNGSPVMNVSVTLGKATTVPTSTPSRSGYTFSGWTTTKGSSTVNYKPGASITYTKPISFWPVWKANSSTTTYKITYHENGGQVGAMGSNGMTQPFTAGKSITLAPPSFYRTNYTLLGFSKSKTATTAEYVLGKSYTFTSNIDLYAVWGPTITFNLGGGKLYSGNQVQTFVSGKASALTPPELVKDGYYVEGYSKSSKAQTVDFTAGQSVTISSSMTLYPVWKKKEKAIVLFPGILGSNLYTSNSTAIYNIDRINDIKNKVEKKDMSGAKKSLTSLLDDLGSLTATFTRTNNGTSKGYGIAWGESNGVYKKLFTTIKKQFEPSEYDIIFYEYDWRKSCLNSAIDFQNDYGDKYNKFILIGHSMGGLVATEYIAKYSDKVEQAYFIGSPLMGAPVAGYLLTEGNFTEEILSKFFSGLNVGGIEEFWLNSKIKNAFSSLQSSFDLVPDSTKVGKLIGGIDGSNWSLYISGLKMSNSYKDTAQYNVSRFWYNNGNDHISNKVNSYYIVGDNQSTIFGVTRNNNTVTIQKENKGDGTVPVYSASLAGKYPSRTFTVNETHMGLIDNTSVLNYIIENIKNGSKHHHSGAGGHF